METGKLHCWTSQADLHAMVETESSRQLLEYVGISQHDVSRDFVECMAHRLRLSPEECLVHEECMPHEACMGYEPCMEYTAAEYLQAAANAPGGKFLISNLELRSWSHCKDNLIDELEQDDHL